ncbi:hypothetical protein BMETH_1363_1 [methanotrophic bacterial endosymbiont of Bathymodiolus sp.]|nr:hypothetical protein BMETH_1363_1 [methanotrophic bacterial endosymbiont of Bathymodiolus sp.]
MIMKIYISNLQCHYFTSPHTCCIHNIKYHSITKAYTRIFKRVIWTIFLHNF